GDEDPRRGRPGATERNTPFDPALRRALGALRPPWIAGARECDQSADHVRGPLVVSRRRGLLAHERKVREKAREARAEAAFTARRGRRADHAGRRSRARDERAVREAECGAVARRRTRDRENARRSGVRGALLREWQRSAGVRRRRAVSAP